MPSLVMPTVPVGSLASQPQPTLRAGDGVRLRPWRLGDAWTVPAVRGTGVCPRAVDAMTTWAFSTAGFHRLNLEHAVRNEASCRIAGKCDFELEGIRRSAWLQADGRHDAHLHARLRSN